MKPEPPEEKRAAAVVAAVTHCQTARLDIGDGVQRPDYSLRNVDGNEIGLLEVTSATLEQGASFWSSKTAKHRSWQNAALQRNWLVSVDRPTRQVRKMRSPLDTTLPHLEAGGVEIASVYHEAYSEPASAVPQDLLDLGIVELQVVGEPRTDGGAVVISLAPSGHSYGIESATQTIEAVLALPDNRKKLAGSQQRRELFVWVNPPSGAAAALSTYSVEPWRSSMATSRPPKLPPEATGAWGALWSDGKTALANALWFGDVNGWRVLDPPTVA